MFELKRYVACSDGQGVGFAIKRSRVRLLADSVQTVHTCFSYHQPDITICMFLPVLTPSLVWNSHKGVLPGTHGTKFGVKKLESLV